MSIFIHASSMNTQTQIYTPSHTLTFTHTHTSQIIILEVKVKNFSTFTCKQPANQIARFLFTCN